MFEFVLFVIKLGWKKKEENEGSEGRNFDEILEKLSIEKEKYFLKILCFGKYFSIWIICFIKLGVVEWMCWNESNCVFKGD